MYRNMGMKTNRNGKLSTKHIFWKILLKQLLPPSLSPSPPLSADVDVGSTDASE
jgi:hypothetical protein